MARKNQSNIDWYKFYSKADYMDKLPDVPEGWYWSVEKNPWVVLDWGTPYRVSLKDPSGRRHASWSLSELSAFNVGLAGRMVLFQMWEKYRTHNSEFGLGDYKK